MVELGEADAHGAVEVQGIHYANWLGTLHLAGPLGEANIGADESEPPGDL